MTWRDLSLVIPASVILAAFSWKFVEQPVRRRAGGINRRQVFWATGSAVAVFAALGMFGVITNGLPQRLPAQVLKYASKQLDGNRSRECIERYRNKSLEDFRAVGTEIRQNRISSFGVTVTQMLMRYSIPWRALSID